MTTIALREAMPGCRRSQNVSQFLVTIPPPGAESAAPLLAIQQWRFGQ